MSGNITREEVFAVCNQHWAECNKVPTDGQIRVALGNKGSYATISKYKKEWKKLDENVENIISNYALEIPKDVFQLFKKLYTIAFINGEQSETSEKLKFLEEENEKLREENMGYQTIYQEMKAKQEVYDSTQKELLDRLDQETKSNTETKTNLVNHSKKNDYRK